MTTINQIRQQRLVMLESEFGSQVALSERIEKSPAQISQWKNAAKYTGSDKKRAMGNATARYIEKVLNLPEGWMDQPIRTPFEPPESVFVHPQKSDAVASDAINNFSEEEFEIIDGFRKLNKEGKGHVKAVLNAFLAAQAESKKETPGRKITQASRLKQEQADLIKNFKVNESRPIQDQENPESPRRPR